MEPMDCDGPPADGGFAEHYREKGNEAYKVKDYDTAIKFYSWAIVQNPKEAVYYGNRSATFLILEDYRRALDDAVQSTKLDERFVKGYLRIAKCHLMLGNPSLSMDFYRKVLELQPGHSEAKQELEKTRLVEACLNEARVSTEKGDHRKAQDYLDQCLKAAPACIVFKTMKAESLALLRKFKDAHTLCDEVLESDDNNSDACYVKALCFYYQDVQDEANTFFQRALKADPDHHKSRVAIKKSKLLLRKKEEGNAAYREGRLHDAYKLYSEALDVDPLATHTNAKLYCNRALVGSKLGEIELSIRDCTQALELNPAYVKAYQRRAKFYQEAGKHEEAVRDLERVQKMEPSHENDEALREGKMKYYKLLGANGRATKN